MEPGDNTNSSERILPMPTMNGVGDLVTVSALALKVYRAYKDAPDEFHHILAMSSYSIGLLKVCSTWRWLL